MEVIIINYNTRDLLRTCLRSVQAEKPDQVIVVDNASTDGSAEMVRAEFPSAILLHNEINPGYGAAANRAAAFCSAPYFLILNSDTVLQPGTLGVLSDYLDRHPEAAVLGPRLINADRTLQPSCYPFPTPLDILFDASHLSRLIRFIPILRSRYLRSWDHRQTRQVPWVVGAALAVRQKAFEAVRGFDETYFMYYEEVDLCYRLLQSGWQIHYLPSAEISHVGGASTGKHQADMTVQFYGSLAHFYRRHYSGWRFSLLAGLVEAIAAGRLVRDELQYFLTHQQGRRDRLAENITAWRRLIVGEWRG